MTPKSKGPGASTGGTNTPPAIVGGKSKGTTPVKVNITKPVKQSEVSKKAKQFTTKINKANVNRKEFPGDKSGAYKAAKSDLETRKGFSKNKSGGLKADEKNPFVKRSVRKTRVDKLGGDIYDQPKFSQKKFDKSLKKFSKGPRTNIVNPFGKGDTPGQQKVKAMDIKAFKVTQPSDIKKTKGFKPFAQLSKDIKDLKKGTRNISSMNPSEMERAFGTSSTEGSAGASGSSKTKVVKQSEVSKKAKDFTAKVNRVRMKVTSKPKTTNVFKRVIAATSGKKGSALNPEIGGIDFDVPKKTAPINVTDASDGGGKKPPVKRKTGGTGDNKPRKPRKITKKLVSPGVAKVSAAPKATKKITKMLGGSSNVDFYKSGSKLAKGISKVSPKAGKLALGATKTLAKLGTPGRIAATVGTVAALSPTARKGISNLAKQAFAGAGLGGVIGGAAASQKKSDEERIKKAMKPVFKKGKDGKEIKKVATVGLNLSDVNKPKKKDKGRTPQSIATEVDYLKKRQKVAPYGAKYTG